MCVFVDERDRLPRERARLHRQRRPGDAVGLECGGRRQLGKLGGIGRLEAQELLDWPPGVRA
jgi:hypothetical protein